MAARGTAHQPTNLPLGSVPVSSELMMRPSLSPEYMNQPRERFLVLLKQTLVPAFCLARFNAGMMMANSSEMIAITTSSSIKVNAFVFINPLFACRARMP